MKEIKIRMCIGCRIRDKQENLYRFQCKNNELIKFSGNGRSFYICKNCLTSKKVIKYLSKLCKKDKQIILNFLKKEIS